MERFRGTKGEWTLDHEWGRVVLVKSGEDTLASVWNQEVYSISEEQMRANAQLIKTSQRLLEAIIELADDIEYIEDTGDYAVILERKDEIEELIKEATIIQDK